MEQHAAPLRHVHLHPSSDEQLVPVAKMAAREAGQRRRARGAEDEERFDLARVESVINCWYSSERFNINSSYDRVYL